MGEKLNRLKEGFADKMEIPRDVILDIPRITIVGDSEMVIENHKGIEAFDDNMIQIKSKLGSIAIEGKSLEIVYIGGSTLTLRGKINKIYYGEKKNVAEKLE